MSRVTVHKFAVPCDCGGEIVLVTRFDQWGDEPEQVYVEIVESYQAHRFRERLRAAWRVTRGKTPWLHAVVLQGELLAQFRRAFEDKS